MLQLTNEILEVIKNSKAIIHVINALESKHGKRYKYSTIHNLIKRNNIDVSHFTGQGHAKGKEFGYKFPLEDYLNGNRYINSHGLKVRLLEEKIFNHECAICKYTKWHNGQKINLELDHIDGNPKDNSLSNLRVLCPNCHAQTPTYCGKNRKDRKSYFCIDCHKQLSSKRKTDLCLNCLHKSSNQQLKSKQARVLTEQDNTLLELVKEKNYKEVGKILNLSENTVRIKTRKSISLKSDILFPKDVFDCLEQNGFEVNNFNNQIELKKENNTYIVKYFSIESKNYIECHNYTTGDADYILMYFTDKDMYCWFNIRTHKFSSYIDSNDHENFKFLFYHNKVKRPSKEELNKLLWSEATTTIAKKYGVSDNAVAKWAKSYGLKKPPRGYWAKVQYNKLT